MNLAKSPDSTVNLMTVNLFCCELYCFHVGQCSVVLSSLSYCDSRYCVSCVQCI